MPKMTKAEMDSYLESKLAPMVVAAVAKAVERNPGGSEREVPFGFPGDVSETGRRLIRERKFEVKEADKGIACARMVRALAASRGDPQRAVAFAKKAWDDDMGDEIQKALSASDYGAAGALILPEYATEIIEILRKKTIVRLAGARSLPMVSGNLSIRRQTGRSAASYVGESQDIGITGVAVGMLELTAKKLAAIVPITMDLLRYTAGPTADQFVRDDMVREIAIREDRAFLRDDGTQHTPKGLRYWADPFNLLTSNGTDSFAIQEDFRNMIDALEGKNVAMVQPVWMMHPSRKNFLYNLRTPLGALIYPEMRSATPSLYGWPVYFSTNIPNNLGISGTDSEIYFVDMETTIIGEVQGITIDVSAEAAYVENSTMRSTFSRDEIAIRAITRHDFAVRHAQAVCVMTVGWGAN